MQSPSAEGSIAADSTTSGSPRPRAVTLDEETSIEEEEAMEALLGLTTHADNSPDSLDSDSNMIEAEEEGNGDSAPQ